MLEMGEVRESMAQGCMNYVTDFVDNMKHIKEPFYVVYYATVDRLNPNRINQTVKAYHQKPPFMIGVLVWYVNNKIGLFELVPELSSPPDYPVDPTFLSDDPKDLIIRVAEQGKRTNLGYS